jgi:uncharacterized phage protein gp47/JayE
MTIEFPTREELNQSGKTDVRSELVGSNPFLRNSGLGGIVKALSFRIFDFFEQLKELLKQFFWDTAELPYLSRWAAIFKITRHAATQASGNVVAEGIAGASIDSGSKLSISGVQYIVTASQAIGNQILSITSLVRSGGTVTITTTDNHNWASSISVIVADAVETEYNGTFIVNVTGLKTATYQIETTPASPATGTITTETNTALLPVRADTDFFGSNTNQSSGAALTFVEPITDVNDSSFVDFNELTGGTDQETTEDNRTRFLNRVQNPVANFNEAAITQKALEIPGNTRIFVNEITPAVGQVTIYFTRDNDGIIPTPADVVRTKDKILEIKPGHTDIADVIVLAPTPKTIDFKFSSLVPDTTTMQNAINASLDIFFQQKTEVGKDISKNEYISAIQNTIDIETGEFIDNFTLTTPTADPIVMPIGQIGFKGTVSPP